MQRRNGRQSELILFDVDKTLVDRQYDYNCDGLEKAFELARTRGYDIGFHSDTPFARLYERARMLGKGESSYGNVSLIVSELGSAIYLNGQRYWSRDNLAENIQTIKAACRKAFLEGFPQLRLHSDLEISIQDLRNVRPHAPEVDILFHDMREFSLGFHLVELTQSEWKIPTEILREIGRMAQVIFMRAMGGTLPKSDVNYEYGICILHQNDAKKRNAVEQLFKLGYQTIYMVGDSLPDDLDDERVIQLAVGNAHSAYTERCEYRSPYFYTAGALDCLRHVIG